MHAADDASEASTSGQDDGDAAASIASMDEALTALEEAHMLVKTAESKVGSAHTSMQNKGVKIKHTN